MKPQPRYKPGDKIGGRYLIHKALLGGMGEVYLCLDLKENHPYALKTFQQRYLTDVQHLRRAFEQEVATWVALEKHPNIVRCFQMEILDNQPFMALEWVAGEEGRGTDLRSWLHLGPLNRKLALEVAIDICRGLVYAQEKRPSLVHRDLKPENILMAQGGLAKITDFGLAQIVLEAGMEVVQDNTITASRQSFVGGKGIAGTPAYMAPEQWRGEPLDERTDIYAVGCILHEMLTGACPFTVAVAPTTPQQMQTWLRAMQRAHESTPYAMRPVSGAPALNELLEGCLAKAQTDRPPKLRDLLIRLSVLYQQQFDQPPPARPTPGAFSAVDYHNRGVTYSALGQYTQALSDYNRAIQLDPTFAQTYSNRGNTYEDLQEYDAALADHSHAIKLAPNDAKAYGNRGVTYEALGQYTAALADYGRAIELDPNFAPAYYNRGGIYEELGQYTAALADYSRAIELNPTDAQAYFNRGNTYDDLQEYDMALADYSHAIKLDPTYAKAYLNSGVLLTNRGHFREALLNFEKAAQLGLPQGAQYATQVREMLGMEPASLIDPALEAFSAFQQAASAQTMRQTVTRYPLLLQPDFISAIEQTIAQQIPPEYQPAFTQRLAWLRQLAKEQNP